MSEARTRAATVRSKAFRPSYARHSSTCPPRYPLITFCTLSRRRDGSLGPATLRFCAALRARREQGCLQNPLVWVVGQNDWLRRARCLRCAFLVVLAAPSWPHTYCTPSDMSPPCVVGHQPCRRRRPPSGRYWCLCIAPTHRPNVISTFRLVTPEPYVRPVRQWGLGYHVRWLQPSRLGLERAPCASVAWGCPVTPIADEGVSTLHD
jgi:hypothetical protein